MVVVEVEGGLSALEAAGSTERPRKPRVVAEDEVHARAPPAEATATRTTRRENMEK